jgi:phospholipase C
MQAVVETIISIKHIIVLILDNLSFDHLLRSLQKVLPPRATCGGIDPANPHDSGHTCNESLALLTITIGGTSA